MISTKLLRAMTEKGWSHYCMVEKNAILTIANELDALRAPRKHTGEVHYQARLRDPILPECNDWINITEAGANSIREKYMDVYEIRELVERVVNPQDRAAKLAKHMREQARIFWVEDSLGRGAKELEEAATLLENQAVTPVSHAKIAAAATQSCLCRTGADGWIFENTTQLQAFLEALQ
jgi:hypothetical protein